MMKIHTLTIVGVGLLGGSLGLAVRQRGLARQIIGVGHQQASLDLAVQRGAIDAGTLDLRAAVVHSDLVVFCTPVDLIVAQARQAADHCPPGTLFTDVGSTKAEIVRGLEGLPRGVRFVGSHPLAGSEKRGIEHAEADLYDGRLTVITPTPLSAPDALRSVRDFWEALGCRVRHLAPEEHDRALALTSHLPHLLASALAGLLPPELHDLTATGFRDTTRIAAGDPVLWTGIFEQNRQAVLQALTRYLDHLRVYEQALRREDRPTLDLLLAQAKKVRDALGSGDTAKK